MASESRFKGRDAIVAVNGSGASRKKRMPPEQLIDRNEWRNRDGFRDGRTLLAAHAKAATGSPDFIFKTACSEKGN